MFESVEKVAKPCTSSKEPVRDKCDIFSKLMAEKEKVSRSTFGKCSGGSTGIFYECSTQSKEKCEKQEILTTHQ